MLVIVAILLIFGLVVRHKWRNGAAKKEEILRLVAVASEEEAEIAKLQAIEEYNLPLQAQPQSENQHYCAVCRCPTTTRCSRCKAVRYCSGKCQIVHWRQGHKDDCQPAIALHGSKEAECIAERTPENQSAMQINDEAKICSNPKRELDDSASSSSSMSSFLSSTEQSETSFDASTTELVESGTPIRPEIEGVRNLSQSKGLKTSVRKFVQHFRAPKQAKSYTSDLVKDYGGNCNQKVIFPLKLFMQLYSCEDVELHPFGLLNCGNSCYANAVLQCLIFTRPIASYLLQGLHSRTCRKRDWCFICKFERLIQKGQEMLSPLSPIGLLSQIQPIGREEDAHEFLRNVVDKMQMICLEEAGISGSLAEDSTLMGLTFGGYLRSKIKCMKCLGRSERCDRMMDLTVEIDGNIYTLEEALAQFTTSEMLGGDDKYKCSRCKSYEKAKKKLTVLVAPNILTIVLKRFRSGNLEKLNKLVQFPEVLNLSPYMSGMNDKYPTYHLYAVVVHLGQMNAAYSGHYVSYVKDFRGDWYRIDDSRVSHVDLATVLSAEAYILFYARHTPRSTAFVWNSSVYSDGKTKRNTEAISSINNTKKKNSKTKLSSSGRNTDSTLSHQGPDKHTDWMTPNDFIDNHIVDPERWGLHSKHILDSSSDSSSIFSASDAGSYSTDSTKDSSAEEISGYIFGSSWYRP
ncbi:Ubiquitin carboxyl-terminal hydrolase [Handroanthus impetiginosus]|uniref:ubiquitinyl hydrolase 1 n=1 Tax=Handroanthus impetiginosus TaxID=429701 RepID=A0A2G9H4R4_9LAMI|nr:Ubiquitin carboxyl-terminal hydrolase [Handroanthus impetiginosus]